MLRRIKGFLDLPAWERRMFPGLVVILPLTALHLRLFGLRRTRAVLDRLSTVARPARVADGIRHMEEAEVARRIARLVAVAANTGPVDVACLPRSLVLSWLLARRNVPSRLQIGARKQDATLQAHAWVEYCGHALHDDVSGYTAFERWQSSPRCPAVADVPDRNGETRGGQPCRGDTALR